MVKATVVISFDVPEDTDPTDLAEEHIALVALLWGNLPNAEIQAATAEDADAVMAVFKEDKQPSDPTKYDVDTLSKVHKAIYSTDLIDGVRMTEREATWIISSLQNAGILFRERL